MISEKETKIILEILGIKPARVAPAINCDKSDLSNVINRRKRLPAVNKAFAEYVGRELTTQLIEAGESAPLTTP
jgi:hypothetical protein